MDMFEAPKIRSVKALPDSFTIMVEWVNGVRGKVYLSEKIHTYTHFRPLRDPEFFKTVKVAEWNWGIEWGDGGTYDMDSHDLWMMMHREH